MEVISLCDRCGKLVASHPTFEAYLRREPGIRFCDRECERLYHEARRADRERRDAEFPPRRRRVVR